MENSKLDESLNLKSEIRKFELDFPAFDVRSPF